MIHIPLVLTAALIPLAGYPLLYLPIHIIWLELIIHPTALLVFQELPASDLLTSLKKTKRLRFFSGREWLVIASVGLLATFMIAGGYKRSFGTIQDVEHARAMSMLTLAFASAMITVVLSGFSSRVAHVVVGATITLSLLLVQIPVTARLLHLAPLHIDDLMISAAAAICLALVAAAGRFGRHG
jgi:Ca2+-transporting ATPase